MKKLYFVGGPKPGQSEEFFRRFRYAGLGSAWCVYPAATDGKAPRIADVASQGELWDHLLHFNGKYEWGEIIEIAERLH